MGLDTFASRSPASPVLTTEDVAAFERASIDLCGSIYSDGMTSIRGKLYAELVLEVTGISLYQEWIGVEDVLNLSAALEAYTAEDLAHTWDSLDTRRGSSGHSTEETAVLRSFFRICAERGLGLIGWW
jgi:hypothetical protein